MWRLHCIRRAGDPGPPAGLSGPDGAPVRVLRDPPLAAWVSPADRAHAEPTVPRLRAHDAVVRAALGDALASGSGATPLPVRFGALLGDEAAVHRLLRERRAEFVDALERVHGRVEMGVQLRWPADAPPEPDPDAGASPDASAEPRSGREYLRRRRLALQRERERAREAEQLADRVEGALADLRLPGRLTLTPQPAVAAVLAHLVQPVQIPVYRERLEQVRSAVGAEVHVSGPWAPYSFV